MKLESLKNEKFSQNVLKRNQMFMLNGGGTKTAGGTGLVRYDNSGRCYTCDYGYDVDRGNGVITRHDLTNKKLCNPCE
jgi:hypothetical protein